MNSLDRISLTNIRCFESEHSVELPRITIVTGENSTGKTTLLGCCSALTRSVSNQNALDYDPFNIYPFRMGNFGNILRMNHQSFSLGGSVNNIKYDFQFEQREGKLFEETVKVKPDGLEQLTIPQNGSDGTFTLKPPGLNVEVFTEDISYSHIYQWLSSAVRHGDFPHKESVQQIQDNGHSDSAHEIKFNKYLNDLSRKLPRRPICIANVSPYLYPQQRKFGANQDCPIELSEVGQQLALFDQIRVHRVQDKSFELESDLTTSFSIFRMSVLVFTQ